MDRFDDKIGYLDSRVMWIRERCDSELEVMYLKK